jgi:hypothetical protein
MMMHFYCFEKHDKTNRFDSDWGTRQNKIENKIEHNLARAKPKHGEGHADHEEAQAGDQAAAVEDQ